MIMEFPTPNGKTVLVNIDRMTFASEANDSPEQILVHFGKETAVKLGISLKQLKMDIKANASPTVRNQ